MSDVLHVNRRAIHGLDRQIIQFLDGLRAAVHLYVVLKHPELCSARRENQILRIDGIYDVHRGKPFGLQGRRIDINAHNALFAAVRKWRGGAGYSRKLRADKIIAEIEKLLLAERVAGQADLDDRHGRRRVDNHQGRRGSRWQKAQKGLRDGCGLRQRRLNVGAGLKENFDDGDPVERLGFDVLDVAHQRRNATFDVGSDTLLHLLRLQAVVGPNQGNDRDVDIRENVDGSAQQHYRRQQDDRERHHHKCVWPPQR